MRRMLRLLACASALHAGLALAGPPVDINTADAESLAQAIGGVGVTKAQAIIAYRDQHGPFASVDDLVMVRGIGAQTVERSRENLTVDPGQR